MSVESNGWDNAIQPHGASRGFCSGGFCVTRLRRDAVFRARATGRAADAVNKSSRAALAPVVGLRGSNLGRQGFRLHKPRLTPCGLIVRHVYKLIHSLFGPSWLP